MTSQNPQNPDYTQHEIDRRRGRAGAPPVCKRCDGLGWIGAATGGQFAAIGRLAMAGRLPKTPCPYCADATLPFAERLQTALRRQGVELTSGQLLAVASEMDL